MICRYGGLIFICHNELCDITAEWLGKVCYNVAVEPSLQHLTGETIVQIGRMRLVLISMRGDFGISFRSVDASPEVGMAESVRDY